MLQLRCDKDHKLVFLAYPKATLQASHKFSDAAILTILMPL